MKKYIKIISLVLIALIFIGTFVFLYQKSQPKDTAYDILHTKTTDLAQITVATGKIEPRDEVQIKPQISELSHAMKYKSNRRFPVSYPKSTRKPEKR